jgi:Flp pilus assembly protein TadD
MHLVRYLPLLLALFLSACGGMQMSQDTSKKDGALAETALNAGTPDIALRLSDATLAKAPNDTDALIRRGEALTELGRLEEARESLRTTVAGNPRNARALIALGRVLLPVNPGEAATAFESALKQDSHNAAALNNLGIARDLQGHHVDAEAAYRGAMAVQPDMVAAQVNLALCLAMRGQGGDAIRLMRPLAEAAEATRKVKEDYAAVLAMAGERTEAERILSSNLSSNEVGSALDSLALARVTPAPDARASAPVAPKSQARARVPSAPVTATSVTATPAAVAAKEAVATAPVQPAPESSAPAVTPALVEGGNAAPAASDHRALIQLGALDRTRPRVRRGRNSG